MNLSPYKILLGSQSPRRQELLQKMALKFKTIDLKADESYPEILPPTEIPEYLALKKSLVYEKLKKDKKVNKWIEKVKNHKWIKIIEGSTD